MTAVAKGRQPEPTANTGGWKLSRPQLSSKKGAARETRGTVRLIARFAEGQRKSFVLAVVLLIIEAASAVFQPYPLAYLIDYLKHARGPLKVPWIASPQISTIAVLTIAILVIAMINSAADSRAEIYLARGGRSLGFKLRVGLFAHLQRLSLAFHDRRQTGDVITRVTGDVKELEDFVVETLSDLIGSGFLLVGTLIFLLSHSWQVTLIALLIIPILAVTSNFFSRRIKAAAKQLRAKEGDLASSTQEMLTSIRVVQAFGRASHHEEHFAIKSVRAMNAGLETARLEAWFSFVVSVLEALAIGAVVWIGRFLYDRHAITLGLLILFILLIDQMFKPTRKIIKSWNTVGKTFASADRIADLLSRRAAVTDAPGAVAAPPFKGEVEFRDVTFSYQLDASEAGDSPAESSRKREALDHVSFRISPGEVLAIVGHSGAGKTTIAQLVPRLYDPQQGAVLVDGHDLRTLTLDSVRAQIGMVLQETILFGGTVADNIAYGLEVASRQEIVAAAVKANADEFIRQMPDEYETELNERAANLSGGQRQRLAIARAFIRNPPILVLDEPTTGLDPQSTSLVLEALRALMKGKTTLLMSHDLRLIRRADRILVLEAGEIVQVGTHDALLKQGGIYAQLYAEQLSDEGAISARPQSELDAFRAQLKAATSTDGHPDPEPLAQKISEARELAARIRREVGGDAAGKPAAAASKGLLPAQPRRDPRNTEGVDPVLSRALIKELPTLSTALDGSAMRGHLQAALLGGPERGRVIEQCSPGKALYRQGQGCSIRYELRIRDTESGSKSPALVGARLFADEQKAAEFLRRKLSPLAVAARGHKDLDQLGSPISLLENLSLVAYAFPIDPDLPMLLDVTDPSCMERVFESELPAVFGEEVVVEACHVDVAHYARRERCTLRYELWIRRSSTEEPVCCCFYGKVPAGRWAALGPVLAALRERVSDPSDPHAFRIPRLLAPRPDLNLALVEAIPGRAQVPSLLKTRCRGGPDPHHGPNLEDAIEICGRIARGLHGSGVSVPETRTIFDELAGVKKELSAIERISPRFGTRLNDWWAELQSLAEVDAPLEATIAHGDYTPSQVLLDGEASGLIDLDTICRAEPALDLGRFCAYVRVGCQKAWRGGEPGPAVLATDLCDRFISAYQQESPQTAGGDHLRSRVALYEGLSLLLMASHSCYQLKAARTRDVVTVLEERMA